MDTAGVSIVINNFNYKEFLRDCIESALNQTLACEVIVVDDGSTDGSPDLIASYQAKGVHAICSEHRGQTAAVNAGFDASKRNMVIFLDSDDVLLPSVAEEVSRRWRNGVSKVQFRLDTIDRLGASLNYQFPTYPTDITPAKVREQVLRTGHYLWPPCSGNAYSRQFLVKVMPLSTERFTSASDGLLNAIAPLYGDVVTIDHVLGRYRIHPRSQQHSVSLADRIGKRLILMRRETAFLYEHADRLGLRLGDHFYDEMRELELRMALVRIGPQHRLAGDTRWSLLRLMSSTFGDHTGRGLGRMAWMVAAAIAPAPMKLAVVKMRFEPHLRSPIIGRLFKLLRFVRST